jgi:hypothetical protein
MTWDVTDDVQAMVNGEEDNEGWEIKDDVAWGGSNIPDSRFRTKEYGDYIPYLEITIEPAPIPSLSEWGIIIVCIFLLGSPFWVVRSHRHRSTRRISG